MSDEHRNYGTEYKDLSATETGLSNEELAVRIRSGEKYLIPELWNNVRLMIIRKARSYHEATVIHRGAASFEIDDLITASFEALMQAVEYYGEEEGANILTLLCRYYLRRAFQNVAGIKRIEKLPDGSWKFTKDPGIDAGSLDEPLTNEDGSDSTDTLGDMMEAPDRVEEEIIEEVFNTELHEQLEKAMAILKPEEATVLRRYYYDLEPAAKIAEELSVSQQTVHDKRKAALEKLYEQREALDLETFVELNTPYYTKYGLSGFKSTGNTTVEYIVLKRQQLAAAWLRKYRGDY